MTGEVAGTARGGETPKTKVFISYSRKNMAFADRLEAALKERGFEPLIDRAEIYAFEDWWKRIQALIAQADTVIFVLSPDAVASEICVKEVAFADSLNKRFAPVVFQRVLDKLVPEALSRLNFIFFDDDARFADSLNRLSDALATDIDWIRKHTEFGEAARRWTAANRPGGLLLRSPALEDAERWIASRPASAPSPTEETQVFVSESRRGATKRRNILTGSLAAGLIVALALAGLAYWQRGIALAERQHAITALDAATRASNSLIYDIAERLRNQTGVPSTVVGDIISRARKLQDELTASGQNSPDLEHSQASALSGTAHTLLSIGDRAGALEAADRARRILESLLAGNPNDAALQLDLGVVYQTIGDAKARAGVFDEAMAAYEKARTLHEALVHADQANERAQQNLAVDINEIGDMLERAGKLDEALAAYQNSLAIVQALVDRNKLVANYWRDLGVTYERIGGVLAKQHKLDQALAAYQQRLKIAQSLADDRPADSAYQRSLSVANNKIGDMLMAQGKPADAITEYQKGLVIRQKLADSDQANALWARDVAISNNLIAAALAAEGKPDEALDAYRTGIAIEQRLALTDPDNAEWQRDLSLSHERIGILLENAGKLDAALGEFRAGVPIAQRMIKSHPNDKDWQRGLQFWVFKISFVGYRFLVAHEFAKGLEAAEQAISLAPGGMVWLYGHRAHSLMLLDRTDEARALYLRYRDEKNVFDQPPEQQARWTSWQRFILKEFTELRQAGLENPLMGEIEKQFANGG